MEILNQIQADLLDDKVSLSAILRKAKVLASQLGSAELAAWVDQELNGYKDKSELPDYRILGTQVFGTWTNGYYWYQNRGLPIISIKDDMLRGLLTTFHVLEGIRSVEEYAHTKEWRCHVRPDLVAWVNSFVNEPGLGGYAYADLFYTLTPHDFEQILDTVRNRLLDFVLKLGKQWTPTTAAPKEGDIKQLVSVIYNNPQGGSMSVFDQRGQHVQYQFNAARDINLEGLQSLDQLAAALAKLRAEIDKAKQSGTVPEDIALDAQHHLLEASREAKSAKPDKSAFLETIGKAKDLLKDITAVAGLVNAIAKLAGIAARLIP